MKLKLDTLIIVLALIVITGLAGLVIVTIPKLIERAKENHQRKIYPYPYWFYDNAK